MDPEILALSACMILSSNKVHTGKFEKIQGLFKDFLKTFLLFSRTET